MLSDNVFTLADLVNSVNKSIAKNGIADSSKFSTLVNWMSKVAHFLVLGELMMMMMIIDDR